MLQCYFIQIAFVDVSAYLSEGGRAVTIDAAKALKTAGICPRESRTLKPAIVQQQNGELKISNTTSRVVMW